MQADITALQYMSIIMNKDKLQIDHVFSMI